MDFPNWFIILIGIFSLSLISGLAGHFLVVQNSKKLRELPPETKQRMIKSSTALVKLFKVYLWMFPLNLIIIPNLIYLYAPTPYLLHIIIIIVLSYAGVFQMYRNKKYFIGLLS